mmetsp:Transcript_129263/g.288244  ORF Transcript_129263/g.288244 Transcript_129263/m.288244 type:complete len:300 (-) Transcript_129263:34-933(-)
MRNDIVSDQVPHLPVPKTRLAEVHGLPVDVDGVLARLAAPADATSLRIGLPVEAPLLAVDLDSGVERTKGLDDGVAEHRIRDGGRRCQVVHIQEDSVHLGIIGLGLEVGALSDAPYGFGSIAGIGVVVVARRATGVAIPKGQLELRRLADGAQHVPAPKGEPPVLQDRLPRIVMEPQPIGVAIAVAGAHDATDLLGLVALMHHKTATRRCSPRHHEALARCVEVRWHLEGLVGEMVVADHGRVERITRLGHEEGAGALIPDAHHHAHNHGDYVGGRLQAPQPTTRLNPGAPHASLHART